MPDASAQAYLNLKEIITRNDAAHRIVAGFSTASPTLADIWLYLEDALNDVPALATEITRLSAELKGARLDSANLLAAARATIAAYREGEADPLSYLRDELNAQMPYGADSQDSP